MAKGTKQNKDPFRGMIIKAKNTGFLFDRSINYYEQRSREVLLGEGYNETQIDIANRVLAKWKTSVGENRNSIPEEVWCVRPCVDCGTPVDNRKFNAIPYYGVVLCKDDMQKRDDKRICTECGSRFQDPAITDGSNVLVKPHFYFRKTPRHVCNWCALTLVKGDRTFLEKRGASDRDYRDLKKFIDQLNLIQSGEPRFMTSEKHQEMADYVKRFEWYFDEQSGTELDKKWKDYYVTYTGVVVGEFDTPRPEITTGPGWYIWHPKDEKKLVWICRVRIFYKKSLAHIEVRFEDRLNPLFDLIKASEIKSQQELLEVWKGRGIFYRIRDKSGAPYEYDDPNTFYEDAVATYVDIFNRNGTDRVRVDKVAAAMLMSRSTYYATADRLKVSTNQIRQEAKRQYRAIIKAHLSV